MQNGLKRKKLTTAGLRGAISPASRPLAALKTRTVHEHFERALHRADGVEGAHCVHELWMRGEIGITIERALEQLWAQASESIPDWLPMRYIEWLPLAYEVALRFGGGRGRAGVRQGRSNIYLVLLDYRDSRPESFGI